MGRISPSAVFYIKLGQSGEWEKECIEYENTIKVGYNEILHEDCAKGRWDRVREKYMALSKGKSTSTRFTNELRHFYKEGENTLWFTFYLKKLWWCFGSTEIASGKDGTKIRKVKGNWHDDDIYGSKLFIDRLGGELASKQGYRATMFELREPTRRYLIDKINGQKSELVIRTQNAKEKLVVELAELIKNLHWRDFETLVDLIFRQQGFQRLSAVGGVTKDIDLDLFAPITSQRCLVQIKSKSGQKEYQDYCKKFDDYKDYMFCYYVVHKPENIKRTTTQRVKLLLADDLANMVLDVGLSSWLMQKSS